MTDLFAAFWQVSAALRRTSEPRTIGAFAHLCSPSPSGPASEESGRDKVAREDWKVVVTTKCEIRDGRLIRYRLPRSVGQSSVSAEFQYLTTVLPAIQRV